MFSVFTLIRAFGDRAEVESLAKFLENTAQVESSLEVKVYATSRFAHYIHPDKSKQVDQDALNFQDEFFSLNVWEDFIGDSDSDIASDLCTMYSSLQVALEFKDAFPSLVAALIQEHRNLYFRIQASVVEPVSSVLFGNSLTNFRNLLNNRTYYSQESGQERARAVITASLGRFNERIEIAGKVSYNGAYNGIALTRNDCSIDNISPVRNSTIPSGSDEAVSRLDKPEPPIYFFYSDVEYVYTTTDWSSIESLPTLDYSPWIKLESCLSILEDSAYCPYAKSNTFNTYIIGEFVFASTIKSDTIIEFAEEWSLRLRDEEVNYFPFTEWGDAIAEYIYNESFSDCVPLLLELSGVIAGGQLVLENILCCNEAHLLDLKAESGELYIRFSLGDGGCDAHDFASSLLKKGVFEEAEVIFRTLLASRQQVLEPSDFGIGRDLGGLAKTLEEVGRLEEAAVFGQQALDHRLEHEGPDAWWTNRERVDLARVLHKLDRSAEALSLLDQLHKSMAKLEEPDEDDQKLVVDAKELQQSIRSDGQ